MTRNSNALMRDGSVMAHSDLVYFLSGSTDSAINFSGSVDLHIPIHPLIYQYSNMAPRLSGQTSKFGVLFFVSNCKSILGIERKKRLKKLTRKPRSHVRILIYRTWPIENIASNLGMAC